MAMLETEDLSKISTEDESKLIMEEQKKVQEAIDKEKKMIERKRRLTGNARWRPARGLGMMKEREWKKYQPDSKKLTDYAQPQ